MLGLQSKAAKIAATSRYPVPAISSRSLSNTFTQTGNTPPPTGRSGPASLLPIVIVNILATSLVLAFNG